MGLAAILLDGSPINPELAAAVISIGVRQVLNAPALAVIVFADPSSALDATLCIGTALRVNAPDGTTLIEAEVTAIERRINADKSRSVRVRGYDRLHRLRKRQSVRAFADLALGALVDQVAGDLGFAALDCSEATPPRRLTIQSEQSDLDLLVQAAARAGRNLAVTDQTIRLMTLAGDGADAVPLVVGKGVLEARVESSAEAMRRATLARGWDIGHAAAVEDRVGLASQDAIELRGADALTAFTGFGERMLLNRIGADRNELRGFAQQDMDLATAKCTMLDALVEGNAALRPGQIVSLRGLGGDSDGDFVLTEAEHRFDATTGYVTQISTEPPPPAQMAPGRCSTATVARVTDVDDPENLGRVRATFVALGAIDSGWMPVLTVGAGKDKGVCVLPEIDDDVLVLLPDGDPAHGIVLGGLYGSATPPGTRPASGARTTTIRTPAGQALTLDGAQAVARLETGAGDVFEMTPKGSRLTVTRDLTIEAPGHKLLFRAAHIDFEAA